MKQGSNIQNFLVPDSSHYSSHSMRSFSKYPVVIVATFFLLFISGYKKNELKDSSQKNDMAGSAPRQWSKIRWVPFKGSFKAMVEMTQAGTDADPMQKDDLTGMREETGIRRASIDTYTEGGMSIHFPANVTYTGTFTAANGDKIFKTGNVYVQVKMYTKLFIYLF
jgi:hypothetical protein